MDVLLVEDDMLVLETLCEALRMAGLQTGRHTSGESALETLDQFCPKALITDINLGAGIDGVSLGRIARARFPDMPVIYISGRYSDLRGLSDRERFLLKPFPAAVLVRTLRELNVATARDLAF